MSSSRNPEGIPGFFHGAPGGTDAARIGDEYETDDCFGYTRIGVLLPEDALGHGAGKTRQTDSAR